MLRGAVHGILYKGPFLDRIIVASYNRSYEYQVSVQAYVLISLTVVPSDRCRLTRARNLKDYIQAMLRGIGFTTYNNHKRVARSLQNPRSGGSSQYAPFPLNQTVFG